MESCACFIKCFCIIFFQLLILVQWPIMINFPIANIFFFLIGPFANIFSHVQKQLLYDLFILERSYFLSFRNDLISLLIILGKMLVGDALLNLFTMT